MFRDKVALVTGASSGIGRATALALAARGAKVALAARRVELLEELAAQIRQTGGEALVLPTDVSEPDQIESMVREVLAHWGQVDILVSNAGQYIRRATTALDAEVIQASMQVNFHSHVHAVLAVLPNMLGREAGHIVLVSTMDGRKGLRPDAPYVAAKFALNGLGEVMRQELREHGIATILVLPGRVDTPLIDHLKVPRIQAKISAEAVARAILKGIERNREEVYVPSFVKLFYIINTFSPRLGDLLAHYFHLQGWET
ncbi:MAG TPA: SDR family NAD(P)-dependent oxidoreductase [Anaerolineales bacterium]|nr:SDR family NAD(P)-dependent oxidoreductase [Anaerolineales bacterium]